jgi:hypothetical protein
VTPAGWPQRFQVRVGQGGGAATYRVVTWGGAAKAEALARDAHRRRHPEAAGGAGDEVVDVVEVEPPGRTARGTVALEPHDVIDRLEF